MRFVVNIIAVIAVLAGIVAGFIEFGTLTQPDIMAPALAAASATAVAIAVIPYCVARLMLDLLALDERVADREERALQEARDSRAF